MNIIFFSFQPLRFKLYIFDFEVLKSNYSPFSIYASGGIKWWHLFSAAWLSICGNMLIFLSETEFDGGLSRDNAPIGCPLDARGAVIHRHSHPGHNHLQFYAQH